jgi:SPP1 family predicted phage head-tail adaptor
MAISIGKMRKRVAIYTRTDSEAGEYSSEILRAIVSTVWANVVNVTGTAQVDSRNAGTGISHRITIRFRSDISKTNELLYDGWIYRIETMQELDDDAGRFMVLECNQIAKADELADYSPEAPPPPFLYVSGTNSDFDGTYEYDRDLTQWLKGETHLIEKSGGQWVLTDGETTFVATDEGGNVPPIEFVRGVFPLRTVTSTVSGTNTDFDGAYAYDEAAERWEKGTRHIEKLKEVFVFSGYTLATSFAAAIDALLTDGTDKAIYTLQDHATPAYARNPDSWVAGIDLTCVSPWNSTGAGERAGVLIGSDCILFANHFPIGINATVRFITSDNTVVDRVMTARQQIGTTDIMIGKLATPIDATDCRPCLLLPANQADFMPGGSGSGYWNGSRPGLWIDRNEDALVGDLTGIAGGTFNNKSGAGMFARELYGKQPVSGDSGSPVFFISELFDVPVLIGAHFGTASGPDVAANLDAIRTEAETLGCDITTIIDADFDETGFSDFGDGVPAVGDWLLSNNVITLKADDNELDTPPALFVTTSDPVVEVFSPEEDFTFDAGTGTITGYVGAGGDLNIPLTIGGVAVTAIGPQCFLGFGFEVGKPDIISIKGKSILTVGVAAIRRCTKLVSAEFTSASVLDAGSFRECAALVSVKYGSTKPTVSVDIYRDSASVINYVPDNAAAWEGVTLFPETGIHQRSVATYTPKIETATVSSATSVAPTADISQTAPEDPEGE